MVPAEFNAHIGSLTLMQTSLAFRDMGGRLKCLSPIREHIQLYRPCRPNIMSPLVAFYCELATKAQEAVYTAERSFMLQAMLPQIGNLQSVIMKAMGMTELRKEAIDALWRGSTFLMPARAGLSTTLTLLSQGIDIAREQDLLLQEARCLVIRGRAMNTYSSNTTGAIVDLERSISLFRQLDSDPSELANALINLAAVQTFR